MVSVNEKAIRVVAFSGKSKDYRMWAARFLAGAHVKNYQQCLMEDFSERKIVSKRIKSEASTESEIESQIKAGLTSEEEEMVMKAYSDLMLACNDEISFGLVFNSKSNTFPHGDAYMA